MPRLCQVCYQYHGIILLPRSTEYSKAPRVSLLLFYCTRDVLPSIVLVWLLPQNVIVLLAQIMAVELYTVVVALVKLQGIQYSIVLYCIPQLYFYEE